MNKIYCFECDKDVDVIEKFEERTLMVKDTLITCEVRCLYCSECGEPILDIKIEDENLRLFYEKYKENKNLLTSKEIIDIRGKYDISQELFSKILGFGAKTIARYENGSIQDRAHDQLIRLMKISKNFKIAWKQVKNTLSDYENNKIESYFKKDETYNLNIILNTNKNNSYKKDSMKSIFDGGLNKEAV